MRIAVDAMGGDFAPKEIVAGAVEAAVKMPKVSKIILVGDELAIRAELAKCAVVPPNVEIVHASEVIGMAEAPALAVRKKKDSSISRAVDLVKEGKADAVVSAGNTGAVVVSALLKLRTLEGVKRPAIATVLPTPTKPFVLIDAGANMDSDASLLAQFAVMGSVYSREILHNSNPMVGLMSIGEEASKGNDVTKEAFRLLSGSNLAFKGNVEGHDLFEGWIDVVVCDGFVGNVVLKTSESVAVAIGAVLKREFSRNMFRKFGAMFLLSSLKELKSKMDPEQSGGAHLLGVNGTCIITHGASSRRAIFHAVRVVCESLAQRVNHQIVDELKKNGF